MQKIRPAWVLLLRGIEQVVVGRAVWTIEVTVDLAVAVEGIAGPRALSARMEMVASAHLRFRSSTVKNYASIAFPGTGIHNNLADRAKKPGIPVWKFGGA
jgi:hypothetical protein